ncbi:MAG: head-tail adaptor protein [Clostridia bacterium]|nr:head-tail adaptor protein [Clostridia bacterium]
MIGGNINAVLQLKSTSKNAIGEAVTSYTDTITLVGFLDLMNGDSKHTVYDAKVEESTHIFICDYTDISNFKSDNCRMIIKGRVYEVMMIDDPMELNRHLEIYLKLVGDWNGE